MVGIVASHAAKRKNRHAGRLHQLLKVMPAKRWCVGVRWGRAQGRKRDEVTTDMRSMIKLLGIVS